MIPEKHKWLTGLPLQPVLDFAKLVDSLNIKIWIRHVLIPTINDQEEDLKKLRQFLDTLKNVEQIDVLAYHTKGVHKWTDMGLKYPLEGIREANSKDIQRAEQILLTGYKYRDA